MWLAGVKFWNRPLARACKSTQGNIKQLSELKKLKIIHFLQQDKSNAEICEECFSITRTQCHQIIIQTTMKSFCLYGVSRMWLIHILSMPEIQRSTIPTLAVWSRTDHLPLSKVPSQWRPPTRRCSISVQGSWAKVFRNSIPLKSNFLVRSDSQNTVCGQ